MSPLAGAGRADSSTSRRRNPVLLPGGGDAFLTRYFAAGRISLNPEMFALTFSDHRRSLVRKSNRAVYYFIEPTRAVLSRSSMRADILD